MLPHFIPSIPGILGVEGVSMGSKHMKGSKNAIYQDKTKPANFRGNPLCQTTKPHLNNSLTVKNDEK